MKCKMRHINQKQNYIRVKLFFWAMETLRLPFQGG